MSQESAEVFEVLKKATGAAVAPTHAAVRDLALGVFDAIDRGAMRQVECPIRHFFTGDGVYGREIHIPAGTYVVGMIHKEACISVLSQGRHETATTEGAVEIQEAPFTCVNLPGMQRVGYAHTDCVWTTFHRTDEIDADKMLDEICVLTQTEYENHVARKDFAQLLVSWGLEEGAVTAISRNTQDHANADMSAIEFRPSSLAGEGGFFAYGMPEGTFVCLAHVAGVGRTLAGRGLNHSPSPNVTPEVQANGDIALRTTRPVCQGEEILCDYRESVAATQQAMEVSK